MATITIAGMEESTIVYSHTRWAIREEWGGCEGMWQDEQRSQAGVHARNYQLLIVRFKLRVKLRMKQPLQVTDKRKPHRAAYSTCHGPDHHVCFVTFRLVDCHHHVTLIVMDTHS